MVDTSHLYLFKCFHNNIYIIGRYFLFMTRFCEICGKPLPEGIRSDCRFCPGVSTCRVRAWRTRRKTKIRNTLENDEVDKVFYQR